MDSKCAICGVRRPTKDKICFVCYEEESSGINLAHYIRGRYGHFQATVGKVQTMFKRGRTNKQNMSGM